MARNEQVAPTNDEGPDHAARPQRAAEPGPADASSQGARRFQPGIARRPGPTDLPGLQRAIGNRAAGALLRAAATRGPAPAAASIQRKMAFKSSDMQGAVTSGASLLSFLGRPTLFIRLQQKLLAYEKTDDVAAQVECLEALIALATAWLDKHGASKDANDQLKAGSIRLLRSAAEAELPGARAQQAYQKKMASGGFEFLTKSGASAADQRHPEFVDAYKKVKGAGVTEAELMAIRLYTAQDYKYINPTLDSNVGWLDAKIRELSTQKQWNIAEQTLDAERKAKLQAEARDHSTMAVAGLKKLPNWSGLIYRGFRLTAEQLAADYGRGKVLTYPAFSSSSIERAKGEAFARMGATAVKLPILVIARVSLAKDVEPISANDDERERLLLPGATFRVDSDPRREGDLMVVEMTQTG